MAGSAIEVAVIGAGPAGITAALYAKRKALNVRIFEANAAGGQTADATFVENYPGVEKLKGMELIQRMTKQLEQFGVKVEEAAEVIGIEGKGNWFELDINKGEEKIKAKAIILCTGSRYKMLNVPGEKEFYGKGLSYCATCDGPGFEGKSVAVIGAGNSGANASLFFAGICKKVYLAEFSEKPSFDKVYEERVNKAKIELMLNTEVAAIEGKEKVEGIKAKERATGIERVVAVDGVFVYIGTMPRNQLAKQLGLKLDEKGFVAVGKGNETSVKGVFAAGDITGELAQTVVAAGSGAIAAVSAFEFAKGLK